jgi:hypothetical protein
MVIASPSASVEAIAYETVDPTLNYLLVRGFGLKTGAKFPQTVKSITVVLVAPYLSVAVNVTVVVPAVVGVPEKVFVAELNVIPGGRADEVIEPESKSVKTFPGSV